MMKSKLFFVLNLALAAGFAAAAEIERGPATPQPAPVVAAPLTPMAQGIPGRLDAALNPVSPLEASGEALADVATIMQGGSARSASAAQTVDATGARETAAAPLAPAQARVKAKASPPRGPRSGEKKDPAQWALHATAILVLLVSLFAGIAMIRAFGAVFEEGERQLQQQMREADDWGR